REAIQGWLLAQPKNEDAIMRSPWLNRYAKALVVVLAFFLALLVEAWKYCFAAPITLVCSLGDTWTWVIAHPSFWILTIAITVITICCVYIVLKDEP
ncbi:MAG: hypothetical protein ABIY40_08900, partial [Rhodanobacteraceae bacterium]